MIDWVGPLAALVGSLGFSMMFNMRGKHLAAAAIGGFATWTAYLALHAALDEAALCYGLAALGAALYAHVLSRVMKAPSTVFLVPSLIPLIPGGRLYYTTLSLLSGSWEEGFSQGVETLAIAAAIAIGLAAASSIEAVIRALKKRRRGA